MKAFQVAGILVAIALIIFAIAFPTPPKHIRVSSYGWDKPWNDEYGEEYVGGDAYNYQMEASLKAGYMSGLLSMKATTFVGGVLLLFASLFSLARSHALDEQTALLRQFIGAAESNGKTLNLVTESSDRQLEVLKGISAALEQSNPDLQDTIPTTPAE